MRFFIAKLIISIILLIIGCISSYASEYADEIKLIQNDNQQPAGSNLFAPEPEAIPQNWLEGKHALGEFGGYRGRLEKYGLEIEINHTNDSFVKLRGKLNNEDIRSVSLLEFALKYKTDKTRFPGGTLFIMGQNVYGANLSPLFTGEFQEISSINAPAETKLGELWYEQRFKKDKLSIKVGKQDANMDFDFLESSQDFVNSSFTEIPVIPMPSYPNQSPGIRFIVEPSKYFNVKAGIYGASLRPTNFGFASAFSGKGGYVTLAETAIIPKINGIPGKYATGFWYNSGNAQAFTIQPIAIFLASKIGLYSFFEQPLFLKNKNEDQGLYAQGQFSWAPSKNSFATFYSASVTYKGIIPKRKEDVAGLGTGIIHVGGDIQNNARIKNETVVEAFYKFQVTPWFVVEPDFQYVFNPGGVNRDAVLLGLRTVITF